MGILLLCAMHGAWLCRVTQFYVLGEMAGIQSKQVDKIMKLLTSKEEEVKTLINLSFLSEQMKRNYEQAYLTRLKKLRKI